jgi:hypothetical protein
MADGTHPVRPIDVWSVLVIVPAVTWLWVWLTAPVRLSPEVFVGIAVASAGIFGVPAWFWAADRGRTRLGDRLVIGATAGLGPSVAVLASATLGLLWRYGLVEAQFTFTHGAPIPVYGLLPWRAFAVFVIECGGVGALSGALQWALTRGRTAGG